jgi:hypothetical protein
MEIENLPLTLNYNQNKLIGRITLDDNIAAILKEDIEFRLRCSHLILDEEGHYKVIGLTLLTKPTIPLKNEVDTGSEVWPVVEDETDDFVAGWPHPDSFVLAPYRWLKRLIRR